MRFTLKKKQLQLALFRVRWLCCVNSYEKITLSAQVFCIYI